MSTDIDPSRITSINTAVKHAGFRHFKEFLESFGLRIWELDDVEEGKAILRGMGYSI